jgi:hypothetical protein
MGVVCHLCNTVVKEPLEQNIEPMLWMRSPHGVEKLISPIVWCMLDLHFNKSRAGFNILEYIANSSYSLSGIKEPNWLQEIINRFPERGYNYFVRNFWEILDYLFEMKPLKKKGSEQLKQLLINNKDCIFTSYIPLVNKTLLVVEDTTIGKYVDPMVVGAIDAIQTIACIDSATSKFNLRNKENRVIKTIVKLSQFYYNYAKDGLASKGGWFRKHVYGSRAHFAFRAVITSETDPHRYDKITIPWSTMVNMLRLHLVNKLLKIDFTTTRAIEFLNENTNKYNELLHELFNELVRESKDGIGLPCTVQRNPSLHRGSKQLGYIDAVHTDPRIPSCKISDLILKTLNADFDGDSLNFTMLLDNHVTELFKPLESHNSMFELGKPRSMSIAASIPKPIIATAANWLALKEPLNLQRQSAMIQRLQQCQLLQ